MVEYVLPIPQIGDTIYIPPGDENYGGKATVVEITDGISLGQVRPFVRVEENPNTLYNWEFLAQDQANLAVNHPGQAKYDPAYKW